MGTGPLEGITVVDVSTAVAGAWVSSHLAEMGADVVLIEKVGTSDVMRRTGAIVGDQSGSWVQMHRNKRGMDLDIRNPKGREILLELVDSADVFVQNFRPGVAERLGIGYADLSAVNAGLVYLSVSGFGPDGPYAHQPVFDPIIQSLSGMADVQDGDYVKSAVVDKTAAMTGANAVLGALLARANGADGQHVEVNLLDSMLSWMWLDIFWNESVPDAPPTPTYQEWYNPWKTADGWVGAIWVTEAQYTRACEALCAPHLVGDPRFATRAARLQNAVEQRAVFGKLFGELTSAEVIEALQRADVPCAPVLRLAEVFDDPQVRHSGTVITHEHPTAGRIRTTRFPARFSETPTQLERLAPGKGEHTDEVLAELGRSPADIAMLRKDGIVA
ncbi:CaiB/BaiF CoA transferase family protein [Candidatus Poriferisodalis sp.]|uniref:CaiB/BaiF CoA transferase family protein n=1 Tax=Candidatus Poriferisodalis sp. TaxID=3101277 RepID=UPI003C6FC715